MEPCSKDLVDLVASVEDINLENPILRMCAVEVEKYLNKLVTNQRCRLKPRHGFKIIQDIIKKV